MLARLSLAVLAIAIAAPIRVNAHVAFFHPSMFGLDVTEDPNRPVDPLMNLPFDQWWFHGHLDHPPPEGEVFELPAGGSSTAELACTVDVTSHFNAKGANNRDARDPNDPNSVCPRSDMSEWHTTGKDDSTGCALAIAYESDAKAVKPEDFTIFSVNQSCVEVRDTQFQVPDRMPACPEGGCICAWFWIHSPDSGGEQNYMNGFRCNVTGAHSEVPLAKPAVPRRCGKDEVVGSINANPPEFNHEENLGNCTYGAKQPFYWFQAERNNMFEGTFSPPEYRDLYHFLDGAQNDIFVDSYDFPLPEPSVNQTVIPKLYAQGGGRRQDTGKAGGESSASASASSPASSSTVATTAQASSTGSAIASSKETETVTATKVITVTAEPTAAPSSATTDSADAGEATTIAFSIFASDDIASATAGVDASATTDSAAASQTAISNIKAALAGPPASLNDTKLNLAAFVADPVSDSDSSNSIPTSSSPTNSTSFAQKCKRGMMMPPQKKRYTPYSFHASKRFSRRRLTKKSQLWSMW